MQALSAVALTVFGIIDVELNTWSCDCQNDCPDYEPKETKMSIPKKIRELVYVKMQQVLRLCPRQRRGRVGNQS